MTNDLVNEITQTELKYNEQRMCVNGVLELEKQRGFTFDREETRILDFNCGQGRVGDILYSEGF